MQAWPRCLHVIERLRNTGRRGYHQQYLQRVPSGYCPDHGTGVSCAIGLGVTSTAQGQSHSGLTTRRGSPAKPALGR
jgi:hypothetical protein